MIRKSMPQSMPLGLRPDGWHRFSLATKARRFRGDGAQLTSQCTRAFETMTLERMAFYRTHSCVRDEADDRPMTGCITLSTAYLPISRPISVPTRVEKR